MENIDVNVANDRKSWDYNVILKELETREPDGGEGEILKKRVATVDEKSGQILGTVSRRYKLVNNNEIYRIMSEMSDSVGLKLDKIFVVKYKRATIFRYNLSDDRQVVIENSQTENDRINFGFEVFNSFDSALGGSRIQAFANRLVCTNGLTIPQSVGKFSFRELGDFTSTSLKDRLLDRIEPIMETANIWNKWTQITPSSNRITEFLVENFPKKTGRMLVDEYNGLQDKSVYGLMGLLTYYNSHQVTSRIPEDLRMKQYTIDRVINKLYNINWDKE